MRAIALLLVTGCSAPAQQQPPPTRHAATPAPPPPTEVPPAPVIDAPPAFDVAACARAIEMQQTCADQPFDRAVLAARCEAATPDVDACLVAGAAFAGAPLPTSFELLPDRPHAPWTFTRPAPSPFVHPIPSPDPDRARALFAAACSRARPSACIAAGTPDRACPGNAIACAQALLIPTAHVEPIRAALALACKQAPSPTACNALAYADPQHALAHHLVACANHSLLSCVALVEAHARPPSDMARDLFELFEDACHETGHERACLAAVSVIETGWGGVYWRNENAVVEILTTACNEVHSAKACKRLATFQFSASSGTP